MIARLGAFVTVLALALLGAQPVAAQQQPSAATVEDELRLLRDRTGEVVDLLRELVAQREADHQLRRLQVAVLALQLRSSAITDIEARIRTLEDRAASADEDLTRLNAEMDRIRDVAGSDSTPAAEREHLASMEAMLESQVDMVKQRIWSLERQIIDLQNELIAKRRDADALEELVMEGLGDL